MERVRGSSSTAEWTAQWARDRGLMCQRVEARKILSDFAAIYVSVAVRILKLSTFFLYSDGGLSAEGAKPESNNRWKSDLGHVCGYVWYLELSREPRHVAQQMRYQNVDLRNGHCLGTLSSVCDI